jgi:hypothetical protein
MTTKLDHVTLAPAQIPAERTDWTYTRAEAAEVISDQVKKARLASMVLLGLASIDGLNGDDIVDPVAEIAAALFEIQYAAAALERPEPEIAG